MCGIAGFIARGQQPEKMIDQMTDALQHRGPDDRGVYTDAFGSGFNIALGHRRLTIIDLTKKGHQPMQSANGDIVLSYNGEVYNYLELREELKAAGYTFDSDSDTEVVLKAYQHWSTDCFARFNGMWGLAIYDRDQERVILSRGRFGQKPLYYSRGEDYFVFASEPKAIFASGQVERQPNYEKIYRYLSGNYRYVDIDDQSFFADVYQVPKASYMVIDSNLNVTTHKYWSLETQSIDETLTDDDAVKTYRELFVDAVRLRLRSDVPVGCMLSGGLDSTAITAVAYKVLNNDITTFSGVTGEDKGVYDESEYIDAVIEATDANYHYIKPDPADIVETVKEMMQYHDEPISTVTWYSLYLIAQQVAREDIPVILNGHGGDELLGGYWDHYHYHFADLEESGQTDQRQREIEGWQSNHGRNPEEIPMWRQRVTDYGNETDSGMSKFADYSSCFTPEFAETYRRDIRVVPLYRPLLQNRMESELFYETLPASLRPEDRNTMAFSLESRSPFLDYRLVEFCFTLPSHMKIRGGLGKWIHREAMKDILPESVRTRMDKAGFIAPADEWFRTVNKEQIQAMINAPAFEQRGIYNVDRVREIFDEHVRQEQNHHMFLWQLINLEIWFNQFFDEPVGTYRQTAGAHQ